MLREAEAVVAGRGVVAKEVAEAVVAAVVAVPVEELGRWGFGGLAAVAGDVGTAGCPAGVMGSKG